MDRTIDNRSSSTTMLQLISTNDSAALHISQGEGPLSDSKVLIAIATYNEIHNLPALIPSIRQFAPQADILVVDDNSPDGTGEWCEEQARLDDSIRFVRRPGKLGLVSATIVAMRAAIDSGYDYVITMDADFSHDPVYISRFLECVDRSVDEVDVVLGSRYIDGGGI